MKVRQSKDKVIRPFQLFSINDLFLSEMIDLTHDCLLLIDVRTNLIVYANKACKDFYGYEQDEFIGIPISSLNITGEVTIQQMMQKVIKKSPDSYRFESIHAHKDGRPVQVEVISKTIHLNGRWYFLSHITDITKQKRLQEKIALLIRQLSNQAYHDSLTGIHNRAYLFSVYLPKIMRKDVSVLLIDINCFKAINDQYGHQAGDYILVEISKDIISCLRKEDKIIRYGGDEFIAILPNSEITTAVNIAERIKKHISTGQFVFERQTIRCSVSIGTAEGHIAGRQQFEKVLCMADQDLYRDKKGSLEGHLPKVPDEHSFN